MPEQYPLSPTSTTPVGGSQSQTFTGESSVSPGMTWDIFINDVSCAYCVTEWSVKIQKFAYCFEADVSFSGHDFLAECNPFINSDTLKLKINIDDGSTLDSYEFLIEDLEEDDLKQGFSIFGRSKHAFLGEGRALPINDTDKNIYSALSEIGHIWTGKDCLFSEVVEYCIDNYCTIPITVTLDITDFPVKFGTLEISNMYPIDVIKRLTESVGAVIRAEKDGTLSIIGYSAAISVGDSKILTATYDGGIDIVNPNRSIISQAVYNSVIVYGFNEVNDSDSIDDPDENFSPSLSIVIHPDQSGNETAIGEDHYVRIFNYNPAGDANAIDFYARIDNDEMSVVSGVIAGSSPKLTVDMVVEPPAYESREITETIRLTKGYGNYSYPNTLGITEYHNSTYDGTPFIDVEVTYTTAWTVWTFQSDTAGSIEILASYQDGSANASYSFDVEPIAADYYYQVLRIIENSTLVPRSGVSVYIDSVLQGTTDANGEVTSLDKLQVGSSHTVSWPTYDNIVASNADDEELQNDSFIAINTGLV